MRLLPSLTPPEPDEVLAVASAVHADGEHRSDAAGVKLELDALRLERIGVPRHEDPLEVAERHLGLLAEADDPRPVLCVAGVVLLAVRQADTRLPGHDDPGLRAVDAGLERALGRDRLPVLVLGRGFAEVPDVPGPVLGVVVVGHLNGRAVFGHDIANDPRPDSVGDQLPPARHSDDDALPDPLAVGLPVDPAAAR